jgi:uncharacterized membrane protein (DUF106 family)
MAENCENCETRTEQKTVLERLNKISGANTVRNWLLGVVVVSSLAGGLYNKATADVMSELTTRIALTEQAIEEIKKNFKEEKKHRENHQLRHEQDKRELIAKQNEILTILKK